MIKNSLKYAWLTMKHKYYVFMAGLKTGAPIWNLIIHDYSKFLWEELPYYGEQFFGKQSEPINFSYAWNHHQKVNKHHWEYWVMVSGHNRGGFPDGTALPMPMKYVREMVADWIGAGKAYTGKYPESYKSWMWFHENFQDMNLHIDTREKVEMVVNEYFKNSL